MPPSSAYRALSDPTRRQILWILRDGPCREADLDRRVETPEGLRRHLRLLTAAGLVQRDGSTYVLRTSVLEGVVRELADLAGIGTGITPADLIEPLEAI